MEELQVIETTSGRQFKPWASREDVQIIKQETVQAVGQAVQDPASITAITSEIASGKQEIAAAINAKGGTADPLESFQQLAQDIEDMPIYGEFLRLFALACGGNYNKNLAQGSLENIQYGLDVIDDNGVPFDYSLTISSQFQYWVNLKTVRLNRVVKISAASSFRFCTSLETIQMSSLKEIANGYVFSECSSLKTASFENLEVVHGVRILDNCTQLRFLTFGKLTYLAGMWNATSFLNLRIVTIGQGTNINLDFHLWEATNVIAEGQPGIDELNTNIMTNLVPNLYLNGGKTLRLGATLYDVLTTATKDAITDRGWTLQRG